MKRRKRNCDVCGRQRYDAYGKIQWLSDILLDCGAKKYRITVCPSCRTKSYNECVMESVQNLVMNYDKLKR